MGTSVTEYIIVCQVYIIYASDVAWLEGFPKFSFSEPTWLCVCRLQYLHNGWTQFDATFTSGVKYDVRLDV